MKNREFKINVVGQESWDRVDDNLDLEVMFEDGRKFTATVFTLNNIKSLFEKNKHSGECGNGLYFWATEMILVEELTTEIFNNLVHNLIDDGEFESAFNQVRNEDMLL